MVEMLHDCVLAPMPADTSDTRPPADTPHYLGHRMRLRDRFHGAGPDALSDYELLEMVLFAAQPRRDRPAATILRGPLTTGSSRPTRSSSRAAAGGRGRSPPASRPSI